MADQKISALAALLGANLASGDLFPVIDVSDTTMAASGTDKNMTAAELAAGLQALLTLGTGCSLTKSASQSINSATDTAVTFDGEEYDDAAFHDNSTNPARITIPSGYGGRYLFGGLVDFDSLGDGKQADLFLRVNGSTSHKRAVTMASAAAKDVAPFYAKPLVLSAGDYVELIARHDNGSAISTRTTTNGVNFWCVKIR